MLLLPACSAVGADPDTGSRPSASLGKKTKPVYSNPDKAAERNTPAEKGTGQTDKATRIVKESFDRLGPLARVTRVVDGDTIEVALRSRSLDVRLIGIDTPETVHPSVPVECMGPAASRFTTSKLSGEAVRLEFDLERTDHYGRTLAYVWKDGGLFNRMLVQRGLATVSTYPPNDRYESRFIAAQSRARRVSRGLWGSCDAGASASNTGSSQSAPPPSKNGNCTDGYSPCLPPASDYDCKGGAGDGPEYARGPIRVTGSDPYDLDGDGDGIAC